MQKQQRTLRAFLKGEAIGWKKGWYIQIAFLRSQ
jgi:hypothetical protein